MGKKKKGSKKGKKGKGKGSSDDAAKQAAIRAAIVQRKLTKNVAGLKDRLRRTVSASVETKQAALSLADEAEDRAELADKEIRYMLDQYKRRTGVLERERDAAIGDLVHVQKQLEEEKERSQETISRQASEIQQLTTIVSQNEEEIAQLKTEFKFDTRDDKIKDLELQLRQLENARKSETAAMEKRYVLNQAGLRDEMEGLVRNVGETFQAQSQQRLSETTRKALEENATMGKEILELSDGTDAIIKEKEKLVLKLDQIRIDLQIAEDAQVTLMKTNDRNGKIIERLREKVLEARTKAQNAQLKVGILEEQLEEQAQAKHSNRNGGGGGGGGGGDEGSGEDGGSSRNDAAAKDSGGAGAEAMDEESKERLAQTQRLEDMLSKHDAETSAMARIALLGQALDEATDQARRQHNRRLRQAREQFGKDLVDAKTLQADLLAAEHAYFLDTLATLQTALRGGENPAQELLVMVHERLRKTVNSWQIPNVTSRGVQTIAGSDPTAKRPTKAGKPKWNRPNSVMNRASVSTSTRTSSTSSTAADRSSAAATPSASKVGFGGSYRPPPSSRRLGGSSTATTPTASASSASRNARRNSTETSALLRRPTSAAGSGMAGRVTSTTQPMDIYFNPQSGTSGRSAGKVPSKRKGGSGGGSGGGGGIRSEAWGTPASSPQPGPRKRTAAAAAGTTTPSSRML